MIRLYVRGEGRGIAFAAAAVCMLILNSHSPIGAKRQAVGGTLRLGPAQSPWPKMLGNARNTGMSVGPALHQAKPWLFEELGAARNIVGAPALDADGTLYIGADCLYALDGADGTKKWEVRAGNLFAWSPIVGFDKAIYVSEFYDFCAIDGRTGAVKWRFKAAKGLPGSLYGFQTAAALGADGSLYITSLEGCLYALNSESGEEKWRFDTRRQIYGSPTIGRDGTVFFTGFEGLYAIDGKTGKKRWSTPHCNVIGPPALGADGTIYVITNKQLDSGDDQVVAVTAFGSTAGDRIWDFPLGKGDAQAPIVGSDGTIFAGHTDSWKGLSKGQVFAIDGKTGAQKWAFQTPSGVYLPPAIDSAGVVYIGSKGGIMYALEGATGSQKWKVDIGAPIGTPAAIGANGLIYFGADDGIIYALRARDGARAARPI